MCLISQDEDLIGLMREIALVAECPLTVASQPGSEHCAPLMRGRILLGSDWGQRAPRGLADAPVVTLQRDGTAGEGWLVLPDARGLVVDRLRQVGGPSLRGTALAVVGASGGVGASTVALGLAAVLREVADPAVELVDLASQPGGAQGCWCDDVAAIETRLASACGAGRVAVVDLPRWQAALLGWVESVVVVSSDRPASLEAAASLGRRARDEAGMEPTFVVASGAAGRWPGDVMRSLGQQKISVWPADRRLAQEENVRHVLSRGRWRSRCLEIAHRALEQQAGGLR